MAFAIPAAFEEVVGPRAASAGGIVADAVVVAELTLANEEVFAVGVAETMK